MMRWFDRLVLGGMALSLATLLQPWWAEGFRVGFFGTLITTVLHVWTSHAVAGDEA